MYHPSWADLSEDMDEEIEHEIRAFEKMYRKKAVDDKAAEAEVQRNLEKYKQEKQRLKARREEHKRDEANRRYYGNQRA